MSITLLSQPKLRRVISCVSLALTVGLLQISACSVPSGSGTSASQGSAAEHVNRGIALQQQKDVDGAIAAYRQALAAEPDNALAHYNLASAFADKKDYDGAIAEYRKALSLQPDLVLAHYGLGYALVAKGDKAGGLTELKTYLPEAPDQGSEALKQKAREDIKKLEAKK